MDWDAELVLLKAESRPSRLSVLVHSGYLERLDALFNLCGSIVATQGTERLSLTLQGGEKLEAVVTLLFS